MDRKELLRKYKETPRPIGIFGVRNTVDGKVLIGPSANLPGTLNRQRFDLENHSHRIPELQADWDRLGESAFIFEVLDTLEPPDDPGIDPSEDLGELFELWLDKLALPAHKFYGRR